MHPNDFVSRRDDTRLTAPAVVIDVDGGVVREQHARLAIDARGTIEAVLPEARPDEGAPTRWVTAGLINAHLHLMMTGGTSFDDLVEMIEEEPEHLYAIARANAAACVRTGVTTACDKGGPTTRTLALMQRLEAERNAGAPLVRSLYTPNMLVRLDSFAGPFCLRVDSPDDAAQAAATVARGGGRVLKVIPETDFLPEAPHYRFTFDAATFHAAREAAHRHGLLFAVHGKGRASIEAAIEARADSLEHGLELTPDALRAMDARGIFYCPTLEGFRCRLDWAEAHAQGRRLDVARREWAQATRVVREASTLHGHRPFGRLLFGSDGGSFDTPHASLAELFHLRAHGYAAADVLEAATRNGARFLRRDDLGAPAPGRRADLVFWSVDPLSLPLDAWRHLERYIDAVVMDGEVVHLGRAS